MIYFDNAATSYPKPEQVYSAIDRAMRHSAANPGRTGHSMAVEAEQIIHKCRALASEFFNAPSHDNVVFAFNATDALNIAIKGTLAKGSHVVSSVMEHNSVLRPLNRLKAGGDIEVDFLVPDDSGIIKPQSVASALRPNTKMIALSHASNVFGVVQPIREIGELAKQKGIIMLVDAAQSAGVIEIDMSEDNIDILAAPGHKCLLGPMGTAVLCVAEGIKIRPFREGGTGADSESPLQPDGMPVRLEAGTPNVPGIAGLLEGIRFINETGIGNIASHKEALMESFMDYAMGENKIELHFPKGLCRALGTVSFNVKGNMPQEIGSILAQNYGIACRTGLHCAPLAHKFNGTFPEGSVRISVGYFNTNEEMTVLVEALKEIVEELA